MELVTLPYGQRPLLVRVPDGSRTVAPEAPASAGEAYSLCCEALDSPRDSRVLSDLVERGSRVILIVSDRSRQEPRRALVRAVLDRLPPARLTVAIANGTHEPGDPQELGFTDLLPPGTRVVNHDGANAAELVFVGTTSRGTPVRVNRCLVGADLIIAVGQIKPHYFAGFGAGLKAVFPGLGGAREVRINHRLKALSSSGLGRVEGNDCRDDMEEAAWMVGQSQFILNAVCAQDGSIQGAFAGHPVTAFREGARLSAALHRAVGRRGKTILVSDVHPVTASLYQASKLVAAAAPLLESGGTIVMAAECGEGVGPSQTVQEGIYELGLRPRLPPKHRVVLVSGMSRDQVKGSYCEYATTVEEALADCQGPVQIMPQASTTMVEGADD